MFFISLGNSTNLDISSTRATATRHRTPIRMPIPIITITEVTTTPTSFIARTLPIPTRTLDTRFNLGGSATTGRSKVFLF